MLGPLWSNVAHFVFEALAYFVGVRLFLAARKRSDHELLTRGDGLWVLVGAVLGAALGSKALVWLQYPDRFSEALSDPVALLGGKTIVGGLLGGWLGVEIAKRRIGLGRSTGDLFVLPLLVGMAIGRLGCLIGGVWDDTYGVASDLPWALDLGDGLRRHPTALYEIGALAVLGLMLSRVRARTLREGDLFRCFVGGYLAFRLVVDALKPPHGLVGGAHTAMLPGQEPAELYGGILTGIQIACLVGLVWVSPAVARVFRQGFFGKSTRRSDA